MRGASPPHNNGYSMNKTTPVRVLDSYVLLALITLAAYVCTLLVTPGYFNINPETKQIIAGSFQYVDSGPAAVPLFAEGGNIGLFNAPFEGLVTGNKWGATVGIVAFILITGGAFGVILGTGAIERGLASVFSTQGRATQTMVPLTWVMFSLGGAVFGMGEEVIPFVLIVTPLFASVGLSPLLAVAVTYVATQIGFATSWMNPFSVAIAQSLADLPLMSGWQFRIATWFLFTLVGAVTITVVANKQLRNAKSNTHSQIENSTSTSLSWQDKTIILLFSAGLIWMIWGVTAREYYLPEIASQFFTMAIVIAIAASILKVNNFSGSKAAELFREGAAQILPAALIVAFAKGVVLLLGGSNPAEPSVLNTLLNSLASSMSSLSGLVAAELMLLAQSVLNFFVTSGSGQAALTMPLMVPLSDLMGISRQVAVLVFQLGDGLTNIIVPTSAALMGCLGAARVDWTIWAKFIYLPLLGAYLMASITVAIAVTIGF